MVTPGIWTSFQLEWSSKFGESWIGQSTASCQVQEHWGSFSPGEEQEWSKQFNKWNAVDAAVEQHPYNFHNISKSVPEFEALVASGDITVGLLNLIGSLDKPWANQGIGRGFDQKSFSFTLVDHFKVVPAGWSWRCMEFWGNSLTSLRYIPFPKLGGISCQLGTYPS
jgi:hypothetical protein